MLKKYPAKHSIAYITIYNKHKHNHHYFRPTLSPHSQWPIIPYYVKGKIFDPKVSTDSGSKTGFKEVLEIEADKSSFGFSLRQAVASSLPSDFLPSVLSSVSSSVPVEVHKHVVMFSCRNCVIFYTATEKSQIHSTEYFIPYRKLKC